LAKIESGRVVPNQIDRGSVMAGTAPLDHKKDRSMDPKADGLTIGILCRSDEKLVTQTLASLLRSVRDLQTSWHGWVHMIVFVNGVRGEPDRVLGQVRRFCEESSLPLEIRTWPDVEEKSAPEKIVLSLFRSEREGKAFACNAVLQAARSDLLIFCDADVIVGLSALRWLVADANLYPEADCISAKEVALLGDSGSWIRRISSLPYRAEFWNLTGRLYLLRRGALGEKGFPEEAPNEDIWLNHHIAPERFRKNYDAQVFFYPPGTLRDFFHQRVRDEIFKLHLRSVFLSRRKLVRYRLSFLSAYTACELFLLVPFFALKLTARAVATWRYKRRGSGDLLQEHWPELPSTKP
jgi:hypothetical protein